MRIFKDIEIENVEPAHLTIECTFLNVGYLMLRSTSEQIHICSKACMLH